MSSVVVIAGVSCTGSVVAEQIRRRLPGRNGSGFCLGLGYAVILFAEACTVQTLDDILNRIPEIVGRSKDI